MWEGPILPQAHELGGLSQICQISKGQGDFWVYEIQFQKWRMGSPKIWLTA